MASNDEKRVETMPDDRRNTPSNTTLGAHSDRFRDNSAGQTDVVIRSGQKGRAVVIQASKSINKDFDSNHANANNGEGEKLNRSVTIKSAIKLT